MTKYLIIGNGPAGLTAAREIQSSDPEGIIQIITEELYRAYSKPAISHYLAGGITMEQLLEAGSRLAPDGDNLKYMLDQTVEHVDVAGNSVWLASGDHLPYDRLLIATGARQKIPPVVGLDPARVHPLIAISDAETLNRQIEPNQQALVIGAGLIGLEAAEALHKRGMSVTVVEVLPWVMPSVLDNGAGKVLADHLIAEGIVIRTDTTVTDILTHPDGDGEATLSDGSTVQFAVAVLAAGVEPNLFLKEIAGLKVEQGIVVDNNGRTSLDNVFAAGDVAEAPDPLQDRLSLNLNWISAREQGRIAGRTMVGAADDYQGSVALNSLNFLGCAVNTLGITNVPMTEISNTASVNGDKLTELIDPTNRPGVYRKVILRGGKLVGAILIGDITFSGAYHHLIREQLDVGDLGSEILTGGYRFVQRLKDLRREDMEGDYTWRDHVWEETPYKKKMNTHTWQRRTGQLNSEQSQK